MHVASSAVNSSNLQLALEFYEELRNVRYTGIENKFYITEISSGNEIEVY